MGKAGRMSEATRMGKAGCGGGEDGGEGGRYGEI